MSTTFADLGCSAAVLGALDKRGFTAPFPIQQLVVPDVLAGHDVLIQSPTGSGKTLAFGVPLADRIAAEGRRPSALILAPTRELAGQIVDELRDVVHARALSIAAVYGGVGIQKQAKLASRAHVLVATPGRLEDLIARGAVTLAHVELLVLDEADRMLDMGFRPAVERIVRATPRERQTLLFSATLAGEVDGIAAAYTRAARRHELAPAPRREAAIDHRFVQVLHERKLHHLVSELRAPERGLTLVFVRTKRGADRLAKRLAGADVRALAMHGNKTQGQRERALASFERGDVDVLVATDVAARGIDVGGVSHVINFDAPDDRDSYVHRVGRTGRAGARGIGVTFVLDEQARDVGRIAADLGLTREFAQAGFAADVAPSQRPRANGRSANGRSAGGRPRSDRPASSRPGDGRPAGSRPASGGPASSRPARRRNRGRGQGARTGGR